VAEASGGRVVDRRERGAGKGQAEGEVAAARAEIVNGEIVRMSLAGDMPGYAAMMIAFSLHDYAKRTGKGRATTDNVGFRVNLPNRKSFSPDAAFYTGKPTGMKFPEGAPIFAAEVRRESDYGPGAEQAIADKIDRMWREVQWDWHRRDGQNVLYWHWSPTHGWAMDHPIRGYDEALIVYVLAAA
jgi:Uma2 family endonuclease